MRRRINGMQGMIPRREPRLLGDREAQAAVDCQMLSGAVRAYRDLLEIEPDVTLAGIGTESIWRWRENAGDYWFRFPSDVEVVRGPVAGDVWERVYFTGDSRYAEPRYTYTPVAYTGGTDYPVVSYKLGVPAPENALTAALTDPPSATVSAVALERPLRVTTSTDHGIETGELVRFNITSAPDWDSTVAYTAGDRVIYEEAVWEAKADIASGTLWDASLWNELTDVNDLAAFLNGEAGFQVTVTSATEFTLDFTDGLNVNYTAFDAGTVTVYYDPGRLTRRLYVHTYVTELGEEGPPSPVSAAVDAHPQQGATLTLPVVDPTASQGRVIQTRRIYRTVSGEAGAAFQFVGSDVIASTSFTDTVSDDALGEVIESELWDGPPADLRGLITLPTGVVAGYTDNELAFSEPNRPHAWPVAYRQTLDWGIVALGAFDNYIVAGTRGQPYLMTGIDPRSIQPQRLELTQACVSRRSMVSMGYACIYASVDGLVIVDRGGARLLTREYLTPDEWAAYVPDSIHAYEYQGRYFGFYNDGAGSKGGFVFDPREPELGFQEIDLWVKDGHRDPEEKNLYLLTESNAIVQWDAAGTLRTYRWRSRRFAFPYPINVGAARVIADSYDDLRFRLYSGLGDLRFDVVVSSDRIFRLPAGYTDRHCEFEITGTDTCQEVAIGETPEEIEA